MSYEHAEDSQNSRVDRTILVISHDIIGESMAGPGIRFLNLARELARRFTNVVLAVPEGSSSIKDASVSTVAYSRREWNSIRATVEDTEVVVFPSDIAVEFPQLDDTDAFLVVDGYDPLLAEWLNLSAGSPLDAQRDHWRNRMRDLTRQYLIGDFFICASERQRDWWIGLLEANGRINPWTFGEDSSLRRLVDVVPFGLPNSPPEEYQEPVIKGVWPGIANGDAVLLWGGGLWPWLDPLTAIRAVARVCEHRQDVRLVFPGTRHPNPIMAETPTHVDAAKELAKELGLLERAVFFGDWIPYADWPSVLVESDIALSLHFDSLETRLAFRTRILDYVWAGVPTICTTGDATSEIIADYELGCTVDTGDDQAVAEAILHLLDTPEGEWTHRFQPARECLSWERAVEPLVAFCRQPRRAPDKNVLKQDAITPYFSESIVQLKQERNHLQDLVTRYEQGHFIRFMRWLNGVKQRLWGHTS